MTTDSYVFCFTGTSAYWLVLVEMNDIAAFFAMIIYITTWVQSIFVVIFILKGRGIMRHTDYVGMDNLHKYLINK